jgi:hypothetical protein
LQKVKVIDIVYKSYLVFTQVIMAKLTSSSLSCQVFSSSPKSF